MKKILLLVFALLFSVFPVYSQTIKSPNYQLNSPQIGVGSGEDLGASEETKISSIFGRARAAQYAKDGYLLQLGFNHLESAAPFNFTITKSNLVLNNNLPDATSILVSFPSSDGYQVTAREEDSLRTLNNEAIEDTKCDPGTSCSFSFANVWTDGSAYGFGYNMDSDKWPNIIPADFLNRNYFRAFANHAVGQNPAAIMTASTFNLDAGTTHQATMNLKVNVGTTQTSGTYTTIIELTAAPLY